MGHPGTAIQGFEHRKGLRRSLTIGRFLWILLLTAFAQDVAWPCYCPYQDAGPVDYCQYPSTGCPPDYHDENGCCCYDYSPIVLDLAGNGFDLTDAQGGVEFDFTGTGDLVQIAWTGRSSDDAWLVYDRNGNGRIDNATEMFGNLSPQPPSSNPNGFLALAEFDDITNGGNGDGIVDERDSIYSLLRLWRDGDHDGVSQRREMHPLPASGIRGINLNYYEARRMDER